MIKKFVPIMIGVLMLLSIGAAAAATPSYNASQIGQAATTVKTNVDTKYSLPKDVTVGTTKVSNQQFLYLLSTATKNVASGNKNSIKLRSVSKASKPSETLKSGTITKSEYVKIAGKLNAYIIKNGKLPSYVTTTHGTMKYQSLIYMYSKVMNYYNVHNTLPNSVSVKSWYAQTLGPAAKLNITAKYTQTLLGSNSYGKVWKVGPFGNASSKNKVAIIVGVHPQETQTHIAMLNAIGALSASLNNVQIWVFDVVVKNGQDYNTGRAHGQSLANKYIVPYIGTSFKLVVDTHGNRGNYIIGGHTVTNSVFAPLKDTKSLSYASKLVKSKYTGGALEYFFVADGTSPKYVTIPIAKKGIPTLVYEEYQNQANYAHVLYVHAAQVLKAINAVFA